jgi:hypothetical protein
LKRLQGRADLFARLQIPMLRKMRKDNFQRKLPFLVFYLPCFKPSKIEPAAEFFLNGDHENAILVNLTGARRPLRPGLRLCDDGKKLIPTSK